MSVTRSRSGPPDPADSNPVASASGTSGADRSARVGSAEAVAARSASPPHVEGRGRLLTLCIFLAIAWSASLLAMDLWTANPRVVSRDQILKSDCVVIARRLEKQGRVEVERVLAGDVAPGEELRVANLSGAARWDDGRPRILALSRSRRGYVVTELPGQQAGPLIYPAEPGVIDEIKAILREGL